MKLKYYLRGLGIGIILSVIILMIASAGTKEELTDQEIMERAQELGMIMPESSSVEESIQKNDASEVNMLENDTLEGNMLEEDIEEDIEEDTVEDAVSDETAEEQTEIPVIAVPGNIPEQTEEQKPLEETGTTSETGELVMVEIIGGEYSDAISRKVFEAGLVSSAEEFNTYLVENGIDYLLAVGQHQIPRGASMEEIANILCEKPKNQ